MTHVGSLLTTSSHSKNRFYPLTVREVTRLTEESVAVSFDVPPEIAPIFEYLPGQHVTLRAMIDGEDVRRSYSICSNAAGGELRVGIKKLHGGVFSTWATEDVKPGDVIEVMPPVGEFTITPDPDTGRRYAAVAAGSGITPILALISTTLSLEPRSRWDLIFGNRDGNSIMFAEELSGLKDRYPDRLSISWVLSREDTGVPILNGRIDRAKLETMLRSTIDRESIDEWFLCGPFEMVKMAREVIGATGVPDDRIKDELFFAGPIDPSTLPPPPPDEPGTVSLVFTLEGRSSTVRMRRDTAVLDAALSVRPELPFSCKGGMCASCKARVIEGRVEMDKNWALVDEDLEKGFVLTCQSHPVTDTLVVDFDQR